VRDGLGEAPAALADRLGGAAGASRRVLARDLAEVERDHLLRRIAAARRLFERGDEHVAELDLQVLDRRRLSPPHAQVRLLDVLAARTREEELRRRLVHAHREVEVAELHLPSGAATRTTSDVRQAPAERHELDLVLVLRVQALALDALDLQEDVSQQAPSRCGYGTLLHAAGRGELDEPAEGVREAHLRDRPTVHLEQPRARDAVGEAARA